MTDYHSDMDALYDGGESPRKGKPALKSVDEEEQDDHADLMDKKSFPGGCKVGDKYEIEITADHGDQFSVKVMNGEHEETPEAGSESNEDSEMAEMSKY